MGSMENFSAVSESDIKSSVHPQDEHKQAMLTSTEENPHLCIYVSLIFLLEQFLK